MRVLEEIERQITEGMATLYLLALLVPLILALIFLVLAVMK